MNEISGIASQNAVGCSVCGRQDETVRYVTYPYVFSLIFLTFQRAFSGCWCRIHRIQKWLIASLVTLIFGWFGFPFGLLFTPFRLFQLARGGLQADSANANLLSTIAEEKLSTGDALTARRCFEASLMFQDNTNVRERLKSLNAYHDQQRAVPGPAGLLAIPAVGIAFVFVGLLIGALEYGYETFLSSFFANIQLITLLLSRLPLLITIYFSAVLVGVSMRWIINVIGCASQPLASLTNLFLAISLSYSVASGHALGRYIDSLVSNIDLDASINDYLTNITSIFLRGGYYYIKLALSSAEPWGFLLIAILFLSLIFSLGATPLIARRVLQQKFRHENVYQVNAQPLEQSFQWGWLGLAGLLAIPVFLFFAVPQKTTVDVLEAIDHYIAGANQVQAGNYAGAIAEYNKALDIKPQFFASRLAVGYAYLFSGDLENAKLNIDQALKLSPESPMAHDGLGWVYLQQGNYDLAGREFKDALGLNPQDLDGHLGMGWVYLRQGDYDLAGKEFKDVLRLSPQQLDGHLGLGWVYLNQFDLAASQKEFQGVIDVSPGIADAHIGLGLSYFLTNNYEKALDSLNTAVSLNPDFANAYIALGNIYIRQDNYLKADDAYHKALKIQPNNYEALVGLGQVDVANYEFDSALEYFDKAMTVDPDNMDAPLNKAQVYVGQGDFEKAIPLIKSYQKDYEAATATLAYISFRSEKIEDGNKLLQQAISDAPKLTEIKQSHSYVAIASVYSSINQFENAEHFFLLAKKVSPIDLGSASYIEYIYILSSMRKFEEAQKIVDHLSQIGHSELSLHLAKAGLSIDQKDIAGADLEIQAALRADNKSSNAYALKSFVLYQQGDLVGAVVNAKMAIQLNPYNYYAHKQLAFVYQAMGRTDEALVEAQQAVHLNTLDNTSHYILGVCYMEKGMNADAIAEFEKFLKNYWDRAYVQDYKIKAEEYIVKLKQTP